MFILTEDHACQTIRQISLLLCYLLRLLWNWTRRLPSWQIHSRISAHSSSCPRQSRNPNTICHGQSLLHQIRHMPGLFHKTGPSKKNLWNQMYFKLSPLIIRDTSGSLMLGYAAHMVSQMEEVEPGLYLCIIFNLSQGPVQTAFLHKHDCQH